MTSMQMPLAREFGWDLKPTSSSAFEIHKRDNGQFCVVLNHSLLRGVRAEMVHWWFLNFPNLRVRLRDIPAYEDKVVPAYHLWHPIDHLSATLTGNLGPGQTARTGCSIHIQEAMQYDAYGWKYPVDKQLKVFYVGDDGWAMGQVLPFVGPITMLRVHYKDVFEGAEHLGVHYHYEVVIGAGGHGLASKLINKKISKVAGPDFFSAWQRHNVIEVGTFENFLPVLYAQKENLQNLEYAKDMNPMANITTSQKAFDNELFNQRLEGYRQADRSSSYQQFDEASFI
ncbi:hypothetical protein [Tropicibacter sp. Alg240-R139]|uniref:hypothetical protein n=1 Tax=Tropicibacter sp. Alg240-R139 TaxID=2305991 RepID=UPI0013E02A52|nr:hypothetical protein [Tropicibacter sp. Alg240-R139]